MKAQKKYSLFILLFGLIIIAANCSKEAFKDTSDTVTDVDGNVYKTVTIGNQVWMAENLKTTRLNGGASLPCLTDNYAWSHTYTPLYCWYDNNENNKNTYGALYNWHAVQEWTLCPAGWHVPTFKDWDTLKVFLQDNIGGKLKEEGLDHWETPNANATNESGFKALPGGYRDAEGTFHSIGLYGFWFTREGEYEFSDIIKRLNYDSGELSISDLHRSAGFSVRCVKDLKE